MQPTARQVAAEIAALKELKPSIPELSAFGDSNWLAIDAQIVVLTNDLDEAAIEAAYYDDEHVFDHAMTARQWLDGDFAEGLADDWQDLKGVIVHPVGSAGFLL